MGLAVAVTARPYFLLMAAAMDDEVRFDRVLEGFTQISMMVVEAHIRAKVPIFVNEELLQEPPRRGEEEGGGEEPPDEPPREPTEEEKAEQLRRFLEKLNPEDFGKFQL